MSITYTALEKINKTRTVAQAVQTAGRIHHGALCLDAIKSKSMDTQITLPEMNNLVEQIVDESQIFSTVTERMKP